MSLKTLQTALLEHCLDAAEGILADCRSPDSSIASDAGTAASPSPLHACGKPIVDLLRRQTISVLKHRSLPARSPAAGSNPAAMLTARRLNDLLELAHARFYAYIPSQVPVCWRQLYTDASILQFVLAYDGEDGHPGLLDDSLESLGSLVRPLDMALILAGGAGPPSRGHAWIHAALELLHRILDCKDDDDGEAEQGSRAESCVVSSAAKRPRLMGTGSRRRDFASGPMFNETDKKEPACFVPAVKHPVPRSGPLGLEGFQAYLNAALRSDPRNGPQPLVMSGLTDLWPARRADARPWASPAYLRWRTLGGQRLVPVEIGRSYVDDGWRQEIVRFEEVLCALETPPARARAQPHSPGTMYLAQHALFTQIPALREDICIPDACYAVTDGGDNDNAEDDDQQPMLNAWLGPGGTITPLHTDPHHNLLAQVVGRKYVRLYSPAQTAGLRPRGREGGVEMGNTSAVDVGAMEGWDEGEEETDDSEQQFLALPYVDCILEPGDTLYIPRGWWHYVRGLNVSFSVSFWWD